MLVSSISNSIQHYIPSNPVAGKFSLNLPRIAKKLNSVAMPIIALYAFSNAQTALAGPVAYTACVTLCSVATSFFGFAPCVVNCLPWLASPTL